MSSTICHSGLNVGNRLNFDVWRKQNRLASCFRLLESNVSRFPDWHAICCATFQERKMQQLAKMFRALGDFNRLRIVALLSHGDLCVTDLQNVLGFQQAVLSRQLTVLKRAGHIHARKEGPLAIYSLRRTGEFSYPFQAFLRELFAPTPQIQADFQKLSDCWERGLLKSESFRPPEALGKQVPARGPTSNSSLARRRAATGPPGGKP